MANAQYDDPLQLLATHRSQQYLHEAEIDHLVSGMHPRGTSWWSRQASQVLPALGDGLTRLQERLRPLPKRGAGSIREQSAS